MRECDKCVNSESVIQEVVTSGSGSVMIARRSEKGDSRFNDGARGLLGKKR